MLFKCYRVLYDHMKKQNKLCHLLDSNLGLCIAFLIDCLHIVKSTSEVAYKEDSSVLN